MKNNNNNNNYNSKTHNNNNNNINEAIIVSALRVVCWCLGYVAIMLLCCVILRV